MLGKLWSGFLIGWKALSPIPCNLKTVRMINSGSQIVIRFSVETINKRVLVGLYLLYRCLVLRFKKVTQTSLFVIYIS